MSLLSVLDAIADRISAALAAGVRVGDVAPTAAGELPAVTITADRVTQRLVGIGRIPRGTRTGALAVDLEINLADPVVDGLNLLSDDRRTLTLPNGPLVRADGVAQRPFGAEDLQVDDGSPYEVVDTEPTGRQVRPDPEAGTLAFGVPLPATSTLTVHHHIGQWDVTVSRYQGELSLTVAAATGEQVRSLSRQVATVLAHPDPVARLTPRSAGAVQAQQVGQDDALAQVLGYRFDAELEEPNLPTAGGVIATVAVDLHTDTELDQFTIAREGEPA